VVKEISNQPEKERKKITEYYGAAHLMRLFSNIFFTIHPINATICIGNGTKNKYIF